MDQLVKRAIQHCVKNSFISSHSKSWSSLGSLLHQNVIKQYEQNFTSFKCSRVHSSDGRFQYSDFDPPSADILLHQISTFPSSTKSLPTVGVYLTHKCAANNCTDSDSPFSSFAGTLPRVIANIVMITNQDRKMDDLSNLEKLRKEWWRDLSMHPETVVTQFQQASVNQLWEQQVHVVSETLQANLETFKLWKPDIFESQEMDAVRSQMLQTKRKKPFVPYVITATVELQAASFYFIADALDPHGTEQLFLHNDLAPYQLAFVAEDTDDSHMTDLSRFLTFTLKKICPRILPADAKWTLSTCDSVGVPFCVLLKRETLQNGICYLRIRNTLVQEQVHVANLAGRLQEVLRKPS